LYGEPARCFHQRVVASFVVSLVCCFKLKAYIRYWYDSFKNCEICTNVNKDNYS